MPQLTRLESELRRRARDLIRAGQLPDRAPARVWAGEGSGKPCAVCGDAIPKSDLEYEVDTTTAHAHRTLHFHFACHAAWQLECLRADFASGADRNKSARPGLARSKPRPPETERASLRRARWCQNTGASSA